MLALWLVAWGPLEVEAQTRADRIANFHSLIELAPDASLEVTETIEIHTAATKSRIRRGIYRDFPIYQKDVDGKSHRVDFELLEVLRNGRPEPWFTERRGDFIRINTGTDETLAKRDLVSRFAPSVGDKHTFVIRYRTGRQLGYFSEHDELYWNVTGNDWAFPILHATAEVFLPPGVDNEDIRMAFYTGALGAREQHAEATAIGPGHLRFETTRALGVGEGLTIVAGFPKGLVREPPPRSFGEHVTLFIDYLLNSAPVWLAWIVSGMSFLILVVFGNWRGRVTRDRDDPEHGVIIARYHPPDGLTPGELRDLCFMYDERCLSADLLELARRDALRIEVGREESGSDDDGAWALEALPGVDASQFPRPLSGLLDGLFSGTGRIELESDQAARLRKARKRHHKALIGQRTSLKVRDWTTMLVGLLAVLMSMLAALFALGGSGWSRYVALGASALLAFGALVFAFSGSRRPNAEGWRLLNHIEGFVLYLRVAERDELERLPKPTGEREPDMTPQRYQELLPYAVALDVADAWTRRFTATVGEMLAERTKREIEWLPHYHDGRLVDVDLLSRSLVGAFDKSLKTALEPPTSSSGFGGGGGFSGGFSGGGGGGGGGGGR